MIRLDEKLAKISRFQIDKSRFRRYIGNIGEMVAQEALLKQGFEVWLLTPYFPSSFKKPLQTGLTRILSCLYEHELGRFNDQETKKQVNRLKSFLGDKLEAFREYMEKLGVVSKRGIVPGCSYCPDLIAKKDDRIYVVEIKVGQGISYLKGEKLRGLMSAKDYGFIPMLVTIDIDIEASNLVIKEL